MQEGTVTAWVKPSSSENYGVLISTRQVGSVNNRQFPIHAVYDAATGGIRFGVVMVSRTGDLVYVGNTTVSFTPDQWYHLAYVSQEGSGTFSLYVNGEIQGMQTVAGGPSDFFFSDAMQDGDFIQLAAKSDYAGIHRGHLSGVLDEISIWDYPLSATDIRHKMCEQLAGTEPGLVAYWRFDEGVDNSCTSGADLCDQSGHGLDGTLF